MRLQPTIRDKFSVGLFTAGFVLTLPLTAADEIRGSTTVYEITQAK